MAAQWLIPCSFVCCTSGQTSGTFLLRNYYSSRGSPDLYETLRIWEAARATSAASTFFDPISIGPNEEKFLDGGSGANNPVRHIWGEATDIIDEEGEEGSLADNLSCLISIGTGQPAFKPFDDTLLGITNTLTNIVTETEATANSFHREQSKLFEGKLCFRFNVPRGMGDIGLAETEQRAAITAMTNDHLQSQVAQSDIKKCAQLLRQRQCMSDFT